MRDSFLAFAPPDIGEDEIAEVVACLESGWITTGPRTAEFERLFASYVGAEAALALSSGTAALHTALATLGIGTGDKVVLPTMTFSSAAHSVEHVGATLLLVDSEQMTLNADLGRIEEVLADSDVRCILPVHLHGQPCDLMRILEMAASRGAAVVDDAAHALPAGISGTRIGGLNSSGGATNLTAFSFYATKNLTTGEGGMLTGPKALIDEAREWSLHGMSRDAWRRYGDSASWRYDVTKPGFKYNMADIQAALGIVQLRRLDALHARRRAIAARYTDALSAFDALDLPVEVEGSRHAWHIYAIRLRLEGLTIDRDRFVDELKQRNIGASVHFIPLHMLSYFRKRYGFREADFPIATREFARLVSLPIHTRMSDEDVDDVVDAAADVFKLYKR